MISPFLVSKPGCSSIHDFDFISIAIISFNRHDFLMNVVDSIHRHADMPFEIVVADDGGFLYNDFNFIKALKPKISKISVNLHKNMGLAVNANMSVKLAQARVVALLTDDVEIKKPFMKKAFDTLHHAPYISSICLGSQYIPFSSREDFLNACKHGVLQCRNFDGTPFGIDMAHGGSWASVFKKNYWYDVGGYSEYDIYGDATFRNKGWGKGYFCAWLDQGPFAVDTDKYEGGVTHDSSGKFLADSMYAHYPKIFGIDSGTALSMDRERESRCRRYNSDRGSDFNEITERGWKEYFIDAINGGSIDYNKLSKYHFRFINELKRDICIL